jgi:hypothetical protein
MAVVTGYGGVSVDVGYIEPGTGARILQALIGQNHLLSPYIQRLIGPD